MPRISLTGGAYQSRSLIAAAQRSVNLFPETNPPEAQSPSPTTHYQFPGLTALSQAPTIERVRSQYRASNGDLYACIGPKIYYINAAFGYTAIGTIPDAQTPVSFADNGLVMVIVDGSAIGYAVDLTSRQFGQITDPSFQGGLKVDYIDTYFVFNVVGTFKFYISLSEVTFGMLTQTAIGTGVVSAAGAGGVNGVYQNVPLTGGTGTGATAATVTVAGNVVTAVTIGDIGQNYAVGNILSAAPANIGGVTGFTYTITGAAPAFDPLDIASKSGSSDPIETLIVVHDELWLIGALTSEVWVNSGAADFTFQKLPGTFIEHGTPAPYSVVAYGTTPFWLGQDRKGHAIVYQGLNYQANIISTRAIEDEFQTYPDISDAIGLCTQILGHIFYILIFPTADKSWAYDLGENRWFELVSIDGNGAEHRTRANAMAFAYGMNVAGDWQNGTLYELDPAQFTENGNPIKWLRTFPHMMNDGKRVTYAQFEADMEAGTIQAPGEAIVTLRYSDDRGRTFNEGETQTAGMTGEYLTWPTWNAQGMARDRIFELSWSSPVKTALNGAFVETKAHRS